MDGETSACRTTTDRFGLPIPHAATELDATRRSRAALLLALRGGDPADISAHSLDVVGHLLEQHRMLAASWVLEDTLRQLAKLNGPARMEALWSLSLTLGLLYERLGDRDRARMLARASLIHAIHANSETGRMRARDALERLFAGRPRAVTTP